MLQNTNFVSYYRTEKEKDVLKREADEAKAAMDNLARDKVIFNYTF